MNDYNQSQVDPLNPPYVIEQPSQWGKLATDRGRKGYEDKNLKRKQINIGVRLRDVELLGGQAQVKEIMAKAVDEAIKRKAEEKSSASS